MSHYVISDLHGERRRFHALLERLQFTPEDTLYILGDIVDRGEDPIGLLREILAAPNMPLLLGNHEYMLLQCYAPEAGETEWRRWNRNNNRPTIDGLTALSAAERMELLEQLRRLPVHLETEVNGRKFYLVHGFPGGTTRDEVWNRPEPDTPAPIPGTTVIIGHTPVCSLGRTEEEEDAYHRTLISCGEHMQIFHAPGFLDIDCGCGYDLPTTALACLRLEDMAEFYV